VISSDHLPLSYLPVSFALALPDTYLLAVPAAIVGVVVLVRVRAMRTLGALAVLGGMAVAPVAAAIVHHSVVYDGIRHFLFVVPPLTALLGVLDVGRRSTRAAVAGSRRSWRSQVPLVVWDGWRHLPVRVRVLQPTRGRRVREAGLSYENDYWVLSHKEAFEWLLDQTWARAAAVWPTRRTTSSRRTRSAATRRLPLPVRRHPIAEPTDLLLCAERWKRANGCRVARLHTVERFGRAAHARHGRAITRRMTRLFVGRHHFHHPLLEVADAIAELRGALELQALRRLRHLLPELLERAGHLIELQIRSPRRGRADRCRGAWARRAARRAGSRSPCGSSRA
jgi:hypothetical protein